MEHTPSACETVRAVALALVALGIAVVVGVLAWPPYALARLVAPRPPVVPSPGRFARLFALALGPNPERPALRARAFVAVALVRRVLLAPAWGLAWLLDEALYGRMLDAVDLGSPVIELSAARSGSTQLARYLEDDPRMCAPSVLQAMFPFVWAWRLAARLPIPRERVRRAFVALLPPPYVARHEVDPFRTDTLEVVFMAAHLGDLAAHLGAAPLVDGYGIAELTDRNRAFWLDFVPWLARLGRKTLLCAGPGRRLLLKGHFLAAADAVAAAMPGARFLTVVREPAARIRSLVNFTRHQPGDFGLGEVPWPWLVARAWAMEVPYCERELDWYTRPGGPPRLAIRFADYRRDLPGTLARVYRACLDEDTLPAHLPREHAPRDRGRYAVDRPLDELGMDLDALAARMAAYTRWAEG